MKQRSFGKDDSVEQLQLHICEMLADTSQVDVFDRDGSLVDRALPIASFTALTAVRMGPTKISDILQDCRLSEMPMVMAYRAEVTFEDVVRRCTLAKEEHNLIVLSSLLEPAVIETIEALRTLHELLAWHSFIKQRFSGRITLNDAKEMTIREAISGEWIWEESSMKVLFSNFQVASAMTKHNSSCTDGTFSIDETSALVCGIVDASPLRTHVCDIAHVTSWLIDLHNGLVQSATMAADIRCKHVTSEEFCGHDVIFYDKATLMRYIQDRCVTYGDGGRLDIDLVELEQHLRQQFNRPYLQNKFLHPEPFLWIDEGHWRQVSTLVLQRGLTSEVERKLHDENLSPLQAKTCMSKVERASGFIVNSMDVLQADALAAVKLSDFLVQAFDDHPDCLPSATARAEIYFSNIEAFHKFVIARVLSQLFT